MPQVFKISIFILSLFLTGCGSSLGTSKSTSSNSSIFGTWLYQDCTQIEPSFWQKTILIISENKINTHVDFYNDSQCQNHIFQYKNISSFLLKGIDQSGLGQNIDVTMEYGLITPLTDEAVLDFNSRSVCGKSNWTKNASFPLMDEVCMVTENKMMGFTNGLFYSLIKVSYMSSIKTFVLFMGPLQGDSSTSYQRPSAYDETHPMTRIE